jgi:hypothetical protein
MVCAYMAFNNARHAENDKHEHPHDETRANEKSEKTLTSGQHCGYSRKTSQLLSSYSRNRVKGPAYSRMWASVECAA